MAECLLLLARLPPSLAGVNRSQVKTLRPVVKALVEDTEDEGYISSDRTETDNKELKE